MRYATTLTLAAMSGMTGIAFLMEWRDVFAVFAAIMVILIGLPVLSLASNFWFGETPPQVHVFDHHDADYDLDSPRPQGMTKRGSKLSAGS